MPLNQEDTRLPILLGFINLFKAPTELLVLRSVAAEAAADHGNSLYKDPWTSGPLMVANSLCYVSKTPGFHSA